MYKSAVVLHLVAGLLLTAIPAAFAVEAPGLSASASASSSWHAGTPSDLPTLIHESCDSVEVEEDGCSWSIADLHGWLLPLELSSHFLSIDSRELNRSRAPAALRGRSPPLA